MTFLKKFFHKKSISKMIKDVTENKSLERNLGLSQLISMGIGAIVGAGIFVIIGNASAQNAGPAITLSFIIGALACICIGLCFAELASTIPVSGSIYSYTYSLFGEGPAWMSGITLFGLYVMISCLVSSGWSAYLVTFLYDIGINIPPIFANSYGEEVVLADGTITTAYCNIPAITIVALLTLLLTYGTETSATVTLIIVIIKMAILFLFIIVGSFYIDLNNWVPYIPENKGEFGHLGISGILGGATMIILSFNGYETISTASQETKNPTKNIPIAIIVSIAVCALTYIAIAAVLTGVMKYTDLDVSNPISIALKKMGMPWFDMILSVGAIAALTSVVLVLLYSATRVLYAVCHDGLLQMSLCDVNKRHVPYKLNIIVCIFVCVILSVADQVVLAQLSNFFTIAVGYIVCILTLYLRYKKPDLKRPFRCPGVPFVPIFALIMLNFMLYSIETKAYLYIVMIFSILYIPYFTYSMKNSNMRK